MNQTVFARRPRRVSFRKPRAVVRPRRACPAPWILAAAILLGVNAGTSADDARDDAKTAHEPWKPAQQAALDRLDAIAPRIAEVGRSLWNYAEVALQEKRSAELLATTLRDAGFEVRTGAAGMPTAFVASYGAGKPVIGLLAEYDALPGMSQKVSDRQEPLEEGAAGHACGHSGLGAGALGAALAVKAAMEEHGLKGTLRLYGTPAEETAVGKVYMALAGEFKDLDVCLHWHPADKNEVWAGSSKALISARFFFSGTAAHASANPEKGHSALDAVELMNVGVNFLREHVTEDVRFHYVISGGGDVPNVVPASASVWYFVRADAHENAIDSFDRVCDVARGAALMTRTRMKIEIETDCHELVPNTPLSELLQRNMQRVGPPQFTDDERAFARRLQQPLVEEFRLNPPLALDEAVHPLLRAARPSKGSTDVGDVSWQVPTGGIRTACFASESPGHCWQNVASIGSSIGEKGTLYAARVLAVSAVELFESPELLAAARADWRERMKDRNYTTIVPAGQPPSLKKR